MSVNSERVKERRRKLRALVEIHGYSGAGRILDVSDNAVRKRINTYQKYH